MAESAFDKVFGVLTGFAPLSWQTRLYAEHFQSGALPGAIDVPTGLGKTAVIALWLIARANSVPLPRRLIYVVDRRAVVDQATEFAVKLREALDAPEAQNIKHALGIEGRSLPISTLRGQYVDNREWLDDPSAPAIVVATVDMIGSRLLFQGYGVSRKMRPYHAGLLGADTLVVLDEAHLVPPFESLLASIEGEPQRYGARVASDRKLIPSFKLLSLSATGRQRAGKVFGLEGNINALKGSRADLDDAEVVKRLGAKKTITFFEPKQGKLEDALAEQVWALTKNGTTPIRCVVFCDRRETAEKTRDIIQKKLSNQGASKASQGDTLAHGMELLVGARRVKEREDAKRQLEALGFIAGSSVVRDHPVFLFATSAGEVGVDLDADHMVCDLVAWERMVQRLGRVNRRGDGDAAIVVVIESPEPAGTGKPSPAQKDKAAALKERQEILRAPFYKLPNGPHESFDASPGALRDLNANARIDLVLKKILEEATTPPPLRPALTRALVDAWSMTSLDEHTGRPDIEPWVRGWVSDKPQTTVVWRKHLPVRRSGAEARTKDVEEFFEAAPPHVSETLETETFRVIEWLKKRGAVLSKLPASERAFQIDEILGFVLSGSSKLRGTLCLRNLQDDDDKKYWNSLEEWLIGGVVVLDARIGGLAHGLLNDAVDEPAPVADADGTWGSAAQGVSLIKFRVHDSAASSGDGTATEWCERFRFCVERNPEGEDERWLIVDKWRGDSANERDRAIANTPQLLGEHQSWAEEKAKQLALQLNLPVQWAEALAMAARLHDEGKRAPKWQRAFKAPPGGEAYAKTRGPINQAVLDGYRHEFGSLPTAEKDEAFQRLPDDLKDLVLHLIAAHHGQARPVIETSGCEDAPPSALRDRAREVALRFARLQKQWGPWGLAWWEALLRAADQQASRDNDQREERGR